MYVDIYQVSFQFLSVQTSPNCKNLANFGSRFFNQQSVSQADVKNNIYFHWTFVGERQAVLAPPETEWYHGRLDRYTSEERLWAASKHGSYLGERF